MSPSECWLCQGEGGGYTRGGVICDLIRVVDEERVGQRVVVLCIEGSPETRDGTSGVKVDPWGVHSLIRFLDVNGVDPKDRTFVVSSFLPFLSSHWSPRLFDRRQLFSESPLLSFGL